MALIGRVHPDCPNVSNPYHECTENCLRKIAEGKGRKNKKKTDNGSGIKDGEFIKKRGEQRRVDRASNPYHDDEYMLKRTAGGETRGDIKESGSIVDVPILGRKKERSRPKPPQELDNVPGQGVVYPFEAPSSPSKEKAKVENGSVLDDPIFGRRKQTSHPKSPEQLENVPGQGVDNGSVLDDPIFGRRKLVSQPKPPEELGQGAVYPSDSPLSPSKEKVKLQNGEHKSYSPPSSEVKDPSLNKGQGLSLLVPPSGLIIMPEYPKDPPENGSTDLTGNQKEDENLHDSPGVVPNLTVNNVGEGTTGSASESRSFSFSGTPHAFEESDDDEALSVKSDSSVSVGKYRVKGSFSSILQSIFDKYGDIAASCQLESIVMRSYYLESVCFVVQELKRTSIKQLTKSKVREMLAILKDVESSGMDVSWLRLMLNECTETIELVSQHRAFEVAKANCDRDIESTRKELESQMEVLAQKEKEVADAKKQVAETRAHLRELELKSSILSETVSTMKTKVESLQDKSLLDKVL